jgi:hypothetical protein
MNSRLFHKGILATAIVLPALSGGARAQNTLQLALPPPFGGMAQAGVTDDFGCSNASLRGRYGLATHGDFVGVYGTGTPPVIQFFAAPVRVDEVTAETFDGHGNATQSEYVFLNGSDATSGFVGGATGTYQVNQDCTGTEMLTYGSPPNGFEIDRAFVLSNGGRTIHILTTKIHTPFPLPEFPAGVCSKGCDVAIQLYADGERQ